MQLALQTQYLCEHDVLVGGHGQRAVAHPRRHGAVGVVRLVVLLLLGAHRGDRLLQRVHRLQRVRLPDARAALERAATRRVRVVALVLAVRDGLALTPLLPAGGATEKKRETRVNSDAGPAEWGYVIRALQSIVSQNFTHAAGSGTQSIKKR